MDRGHGEDGTISDLPWTAVFDPVANARALSAIQAEGFRAAAKLVDRFVAVAGTNGNGAAPASETSENGSTASDSAPGSDVDLIVRSWWSSWGRLLRSMPGSGAGGTGPATFELTGDNANVPVQLQADGPGRVATEMWLHNSSAEDLGDVGLLCGGLLSHDGHVLAASAVWFTPDCVPMPARSSRGITMEVVVEEGVPAGRYRGTVLAQGYPDLWLPIVVTVRAPSE